MHSHQENSAKKSHAQPPRKLSQEIPCTATKETQPRELMHSHQEEGQGEEEPLANDESLN
jgi:hypothetical protein